MVFESFSDHSISLANADGETDQDKVYKDLTSYVANGHLDPTAVSDDVVLEFLNPRRKPISFDARIFAPGGVTNIPPVAVVGDDFSITLSPGESERIVTLDGSASTDEDGTIVSYTWTGNPDPDDVVQPTVYLSSGNYTFTLVV